MPENKRRCTNVGLKWGRWWASIGSMSRVCWDAYLLLATNHKIYIYYTVADHVFYQKWGTPFTPPPPPLMGYK